MNYRHVYHAGNCADVIKHTVILLLLDALKEKDKAFCYIDTHAGCGIYDLNSIEANKTGEYKEGVGLLTQQYQHPILNYYFKLIVSVEPKHYPGSPWFAKSMLRSQDKMILNELHPDDIKTLKNVFKYDPQVNIHQRDAYEFLPAILPPNPRRGLVLIDPPFEDFSEREHMVALMQKSYKKWQEGIYVLWTPLKNEPTQKFYEKLIEIPFKNKVVLKFHYQSNFAKDNPLLGCSLIIFNVPYNAEAKLMDLMAELKMAFTTLHFDYEMKL